MFDVSCCWDDEFSWLALEPEPTVPDGLAAGPFLFPGWPAIPAPELFALGAVEGSGFVAWASAAEVEVASARTRVHKIRFTAFLQMLLPPCANV
jgi:hypothetical protein